MKYRENTRTSMDIKAKAIIICSLALAFAVSFIPLWQIGSAASIRFQTAMVQEKLNDLDKEDRALRASISEINRENMKLELSQVLASL